MASKNLKFGELEVCINWVIAICVLLTMSGLIRLGIWQLSRAQEKIQLQESFLEFSEEQATPIENLPIAGREFDAMQHQNRQVELTGRFLNENSIFLIYQTYEEQLGFEVVTPFELSALDLIVMVSRGWSGVTSEGELARVLPKINGELVLQGQIYVPTEKEAVRTNELVNESWPLTTRYLNINELSRHFDSSIFPYVIRLGLDQPGVLVRHWPAVTANTSQNFSYALQWFSMAIAVFIVSLILSSNILTLMKRRMKPL
jgi:surfeit locus 1 family protein